MVMEGNCLLECVPTEQVQKRKMCVITKEIMKTNESFNSSNKNEMLNEADKSPTTLVSKSHIQVRHTDCTSTAEQNNRHCKLKEYPNASSKFTTSKQLPCNHIRWGHTDSSVYRKQTPSYSRTFFHHILYTLVVTLLFLSLTIPVHAHGDTSTINESQTKSHPQSIEEIFYSPENWIMEELDTDELQTLHKPQLQITKTIANIGYLYRAEVLVDLKELNTQDHTLKFQASEAGRQQLPAWLHLDKYTGELSGIPLPKDMGRVYLRVDVLTSNEDGSSVNINEMFALKVISKDSLQPLLKNEAIGDHTVIGDCKPSKSNFPANCLPSETPVLANILFTRDFNKLKPLHRVNLVLAVADLVGVCSNRIWLNNIDWNSDESVKLWSQLATAELKNALNHATILSFLVDCESTEVFRGSINVSNSARMMDMVLLICSNGLALDEDAYTMIDCYQWFINSQDIVLAQSRASYEDFDIPKIRVKRQEETEIDFTDENDNLFPMSSSLATRSSLIASTLATTSSLTAITNHVSSSALSTKSTILTVMSSASTQGIGVFEPASSIVPTSTMEDTAISILPSLTTPSSIANTDRLFQQSTIVRASVSASILPSVPAIRVIPSSDIATLVSGREIAPTTTSASADSSSTRVPITSSEIFKAFTSIPQFLMSSIIDFESITTVAQMIVTPTRSRVFSFSINPSIEVLSSTSIISSSQTPMPSIIANVTRSSSQSINFSLSSPVRSTSVRFSASSPAQTSFPSTPSFSVRSVQPTTLTGIQTTSSSLTPSLTQSPSLSPTFTLQSSSIVFSTSPAIFSTVSFASTIEDTSFIFMPSTIVEPLMTTDVIFTIQSTPVITPTSSPHMLMPLPTSELSLSMSVFTPSPIDLSMSVFTPSPIDSSITISLTFLPSFTISMTTAPDSITFVQPITTQVVEVTTTPLQSLEPSTTALQSLRSSLPPLTTEFFDIITTSVPEFFATPTSITPITETRSPPVSSLSFTQSSSLPQTPSSISPLATSELFFTETTNVFFAMTSNILLPTISQTRLSETTASLSPTDTVLPTSTSTPLPTTTEVLLPMTTNILLPEFSSTDFLFPEPTTTLTSAELTQTPSLTLISTETLTPHFSFSSQLTTSPAQETTTFSSLPQTPIFTITPSFTLLPSTSLVSTIETTPSFTLNTPLLTTMDTEIIFFPLSTTDLLMPFSPTPIFSSSVLLSSNIVRSTPTSFSSVFPSSLQPSSSSIIVTTMLPSIPPTPTPRPSICQGVDCGNGVCIDQGQDFICECFIGWTGNFCDSDINFCSLEFISSGFSSSAFSGSGQEQDGPCSLEGTSQCIDGNSTYACMCLPGYTGQNCSMDIDDCISNPCMNNGTCNDLPAGIFVCNCTSNFTGSLCDIDLVPCSPDPCFSNEICLDLGNGIFECINVSTSSTIVTSTSISVPTSMLTAISMNSIQSSITPTTSVMTTLSVSTFLTLSFTVTPTPTPSPNISICGLVSCGNGTCVDLGVEGHNCECFRGWAGDACDVDIDECAEEPCDSVGALLCRDGNSTFFCECVTGFTGQNCSMDINECEVMPCRNNATCINGLFGMFECICTSNFTGSLCETNLDPCASNPCSESEMCINNDNGTFTCMIFPMPSSMPISSLMFTTTQLSTLIDLTSTIVTIVTTSLAVDTSTIATISLTIAPTSTIATSSFTMSLTSTIATTFLVTNSSAVMTTTILTPSPTPTPLPSNTEPVLLNQIGTLLVNQGRTFQFAVPESTFFDRESGTTSQLQLSLLDPRGNQLPNTTWIQLRLLSGDVLVIEGLPLSNQVIDGSLTDHVFLLRAEDNRGAAAHDLVTVRVISVQEQPENFVVAFFEGNFEAFSQNLTARIELYNALASLGPDSNTDIFINVFTSGSIAAMFTNTSITNRDCIAFLEWVQSIIEMSNGQITYTIEFISAVSPFVPTNMPQIVGPCSEINITTPSIVTPPTSGLEFGAVSDRILLLATIIPATILACLCLCCGIMACIIYRRRRSERAKLVNPAMEQTFLHRRPVILAGELDLPPRGRRPVILVNEGIIRRDDHDGPLLQEVDEEEVERIEEEAEYEPLLTLSRRERLLPQLVRPPPDYVDPPDYHSNTYDYARFRLQ